MTYWPPLQRLPKDIEVLAFESGCEDDEVEWQGGRVYLRRDDPPRG